MVLGMDIKKKLKESELLVDCYNKIHFLFNSMLFNLSPLLLVKYRYFLNRGILPDLENPKSFEEKLLWLMLYWQNPLKSICADKYEVRSYVKKFGLEHVLPEITGVYNSTDEINFSNLPDRFVLKCTHGCGFNIICKDKKTLDIKKTKRMLDKWMKIDISKGCGEIHYAEIKPRIICEKFLDDLSGDLPNDYKVYCFSGKAYCTLACTERGSGDTKFDIYDRDWKNKLPYSRSSLLADRNIPKPDAYEEMIAAAEKLSKPFPFVRIDFYSIKGKAILGEMTFTPNGCIDKGYTDKAQHVFGEMISLPEKRF